MKKILIIDNEEEFCNLVKETLGLWGFEVAIATDGKHGLNLAKRERPDIILLDIIMPGMDGLQVLERLKADAATSEIPVIMLTAVDAEESKEKALALYDEEYITKPVHFSDLKLKIDEVFKRKRL